MPKRILIVDDSTIVREVVRTCLEARLEHVVCSEAVNGLDAIHRAEVVGPDLIVLDLSMPMMSGLEAAAILREMLPRVPIILFTLHKDPVIERNAQAVGICAVVSKMDQIDALLEQVLNFAEFTKVATA